MLIFLDTEFTDFLNCDLISIGLVSADGMHEFYGERTDFNYDWCSDFTRAAVLAHLGEIPHAKMNRQELSVKLNEWFAGLPQSCTLACDSFTDWELLLDAFDDRYPSNILGRYDLTPLTATAAFNEALCRYHSPSVRPWHHALHDARAIRLGWLASQAPDIVDGG